ncbi:hypothetical protein C8Q75DRAFT_728952 [Abortiporus biennis]|nr:hypothetical protein C8Q75DRAFT_728952 [Abortiporus biennis]
MKAFLYAAFLLTIVGLTLGAPAVPVNPNHDKVDGTTTNVSIDAVMGKFWRHMNDEPEAPAHKDVGKQVVIRQAMFLRRASTMIIAELIGLGYLVLCTGYYTGLTVLQQVP